MFYITCEVDTIILILKKNWYTERLSNLLRVTRVSERVAAGTEGRGQLRVAVPQTSRS